MKRLDLTGHIFELLTVKRLVGRVPVGTQGQHRILWECVCSCGNITTVATGDLRSGHTVSCGCKKIQKSPNALIRMREYHIYRGIIMRCENPNVLGFKHYGGAGVKMCTRWRESFQAFLDDMGPRPTPQHSIDRYPDPYGDYSPENCRWATNTQQGRNKKNTRYVVYKGERMSLTEAVERAGNLIHYETAWARIKICGWSVEKSVETPRVHESHYWKNKRHAKSA